MLPPARRKGQDPIDVPLLIALARIEEADSAAAAWTAMSWTERAAALGDVQGRSTACSPCQQPGEG